jgi:DNA-binding transcriptional MerR regulator
MFQAGEFSKLAQVSKRLLRYYEEIGLFAPEHVDRFTGYRYYTAAQLPRLNKILALKELGLSLDQIKRVLDGNISIDEIRGMLTLKKAEAQQRLRVEQERFRYIESRIRQINEHGVLEDYDVVLKSVPALRVLTVRRVLPEITEMRTMMLTMLRVLPSQVGARNLRHMIVITHAEAYDWEDFDVEIGYVVDDAPAGGVSLPEGPHMTVRSLEPVETMATVTRVGASRLGSGCYHALAQWIEGNAYRIAGPGREVFLQLEANRDEEMVTEIQMPIEKALPRSLLPVQS